MKVLIIVSVLYTILHISCAFITMKNGYLFDSNKQEYWIPHGISYQTYNQPLGQYQSPEQIEYDLRQMSLHNVNSIRVDLSPGAIEGVTQGVFNWALIDHLVNTAQKYNIRIFAIIGYQYLPYWTPGSNILFKEGNNVDPGWHTQHPPCPAAGEYVTNTTYIYTQKWVAASMSLGMNIFWF